LEKQDFYRDARRDLAGPLQGIRVLEATTSWAGPMCGCMFADLGADVIKVEATEGEVGRRVGPFVTGEGSRVSFLHATVNRNKRSLTLDLRTPAGRVIFLKLAARSDIVCKTSGRVHSTSGVSVTKIAGQSNRISSTCQSAVSGSSDLTMIVPVTIQ
jgi:hypothetical protein